MRLRELIPGKGGAPTGTRPRSAEGKTGTSRRLTATLRQLLRGTGETGTCRIHLSFRDIGPLLLPWLDEGEMARRADEIRRAHPGLRTLTMRPSALAEFLTRPTPPEAVRLLTRGSCWPEVLFFEVPSTPGPGGGQGRGTIRIHLSSARAVHDPAFDLFHCPCGDYSILAFDDDGHAYEAIGILLNCGLKR